MFNRDTYTDALQSRPTLTNLEYIITMVGYAVFATILKMDVMGIIGAGILWTALYPFVHAYINDKPIFNRSEAE